jgi:hypothetical protein
MPIVPSVLYLHGGLPRTGTTSFQAVLFRNRRRLAEVGVLYPDRWRDGWDAHHGFVALLEPGAADNGEVEEFHHLLRSNREEAVLISTEHLTTRLRAVDGRLKPLLSLLGTAGEITPVTCLWTLRRADSLLTSVYLLRVWNDQPVPAPAEFFHEHTRVYCDGVGGLCEVSDALDGNAVYSRYKPGGAHHEEILRTVGVADPVRREIVDELRGGPRLNLQLTQKAAAAMLNLEAISARAGIEIPHAALKEAFFYGALKFDDDARCELIGSDRRRAVHEEVLAASATVGFEPYRAFFGAEEIQPASPVSLDPDVLTDEDLGRLVAHVADAGVRMST